MKSLNNYKRISIQTLQTISTDWFNYEQDYYSIENPSERLELFLALKGYEYDVEMNSKGWQSQVERAMKNA